MLIEDLTLLKCIGKGAFGEVYLTSKIGTKEKFATKKIDKKFIKEKKKKYLDNEIKILNEISHENIIKLFEVKETYNSYYLVMELCTGGSLFDCLDEYQKKYNQPFSEEIVQYLMKQIVSAIKYIHNKNIIHRDLKLENILVNFNSEEDKKNINMLKSKVKLIDFGFARYLSKPDLAFSILGSPLNMDPGILEVYNKLKKMEYYNKYGYDEKADIWSLGSLCYEMIIGKSPFDSKSLKQLINKVKKGKYYLPTYLSKEVISFINGMLKYDLKKRLSADLLYKHEFLNLPYNKLTRINLGKSRDELELDINKSIWNIFENEQVLIKINRQDNQEIPKIIKTINMQKIPKPKIPNVSTEENDNDLNNEYLEAFKIMNNDFIYIEPKLIPFIPDINPDLISKITEDNKNNF